MTTPSFEQIQAMSKEELAAQNKRLTRRLAMHMVGLLFVKIAAPKVAMNLITKAAVTAAKRV